MAKPNVSTTAVALTAEYDMADWLNATDAAKVSGRNKLPHEWLRLPATKVLFHEIEAFAGLIRSELVRTKKGGSNSSAGTWLHPLISGHFLHWLRASPGFVYAALFDDGTIKVGRGGCAESRLATHAVAATLRNSLLVDSCISPFVPDCHWAERALIAFCSERGTACRGKETFQGVSFGEISAFIKSIGTPQQ